METKIYLDQKKGYLIGFLIKISLDVISKIKMHGFVIFLSIIETGPGKLF